MSSTTAARSPVGRCGAPPAPWHAVCAVLLLALPALAAHFSPTLSELLAYDRARIAAGETWRLLTAHWAHWSTEHLAWDLLAFAVLVHLGWQTCRRRVLLTLGAASLAIGLAVWTALPHMQEYRGLSGPDSALFTLLGVVLLRDEIVAGRRGFAVLPALALCGFVAKIGFEIATGSAVFVQSADFAPVPLAHLVGGVVGAGIALLPGRGARAQRAATQPNKRSSAPAMRHSSPCVSSRSLIPRRSATA